MTNTRNRWCVFGVSSASRDAVRVQAASTGRTIGEVLEEELEGLRLKMRAWRPKPAPYTPLPAATFRDAVEVTDGGH
jgi:hypothetical protein